MNYEPLTEAEYTELKEFINGLEGWLPDNKATYTWQMFLKLSNHTEPQPCTCASSGKHWKRAVDFLTDWIKQKEQG